MKLTSILATAFILVGSAAMAQDTKEETTLPSKGEGLNDKTANTTLVSADQKNVSTPSPYSVETLSGRNIEPKVERTTEMIERKKKGINTNEPVE